MKPIRFAALSCLLLLPSAVAEANWTATGRYTYIDRAYNQTGFTGSEPQLPIRYADVEILDSKNKILATGATDPNGNYSILVVDSRTRTVYTRVTTRSVRTSDLFVDVQANTSGTTTYYSVRTPNLSNHNPNVDVNFGTIVALKGTGGEAFNLFDQAVRGADYIASLRGSRPGSADDLSIVWKINRGVGDSTYGRSTRTISLRDTAGYDDTVVLHEMGHYFVTEFSGTDYAAGAHTFSNCNVDIKLAWEEGFATYWGNSAIRFAGMTGCNIYMRSNGGPAPALVRYADLETDNQYFCQGDESEVSVFTFLWDINDSATTPDSTPGVDDASDALALPDTLVWEVMRDAMPTAVNKSLEDFWDGWFKPPVSNGFLPEMLAISNLVGVNFSEDASEVNNSIGTASLLTAGGGSLPATLFYDPDGDGAGQADTDIYTFSATSGQLYRAETTNLISDCNTFLELIDSDGTTVLASNDDRAVGDFSSLIDWTAPRSDVFYLRVTHTPDLGIYGSYTISVNPL